MKMDHNLEFESLRKAEIIKCLEFEGFEKFRNINEEKSEDEDQTGNGGEGFNYLMNAKPWNFCKEAQKLNNKKAEKKRTYFTSKENSTRNLEGLDALWMNGT
ncbi:hypothetical protein RclHR1_17760002 [Rhizophagus clarus]|uniref:Uncharacterized protein n=1 Tax=Rhizophagus clarus TaxID=94130 RepID=A0A2Z6R172_9GLOM|nr:hypothetical protein RclHR1_17760002 [Rhizophagus clarus]